jgi:PKD-like domain
MRYYWLVILLFCVGTVQAQFVRNSGLTVINSANVAVNSDWDNQNHSITNNGTITLSDNWTSTGGYNPAGTGGFVLTNTITKQFNHNKQFVATLTKNGAGISQVDDRLIIKNNLTLTNGLLSFTGVNDTLVMQTNVVSTATPTSYVVGKVTRYGTGDLFFPVSRASNYLPITIFQVAGTNPRVTVSVEDKPGGYTAGANVSALTTFPYVWRSGILRADTASFVEVQYPTSLSSPAATIVARGVAGAKYDGLGNQSINIAAGTTKIKSFNRGLKGLFTVAVGAATPLDPPIASAATAVSDIGFTAAWSSIAGATGYQLHISADNFVTLLAGYNPKVVTTTTEIVTGLSASTAYKFRVRATNASGTSASSNVINVTTNPIGVSITTSSVSTSNCAGNAISVPYTITGAYNAGNTFTSQLSTASGSFAAPVTIGSIVSVIAGTISATIPANTPTGAGYRIRVVSSNPVVTGSDNGANVTVNATPATPGAISGTATICSGSSNTYSITAVSGATSYTWTLPSGWTGTSTTTLITAIASSTAGNITVTASNGCGTSAASSQAIVVNVIPPTPGAISGTATICTGSSNTYSITAVSGATSYTWTLPSGWTGTSTTASITATASSTSGNISVTASNACGTSAAASKAIVVSTTPTPATPGAISGTTTICSGSSNTYSISAVSGATSYTWTLPGGWTGTSTTTSITATASPTAGNITVTASNVCGTSAASSQAIVVNVIPPTPGAISGTATICSGSSNTYSIAAVSGATSYTWTLPSGWTGTSTTASITATASPTSGNVTVTASNACGTSAASSQAIIVSTAAPVTPGVISGTTTICSGSSNTYSIAAVSGATSYTWTLPSGWTGTSTTNSLTATASSTAGNITVTASNGCGTSAASSQAIVINVIPSTPGAISGAASICSGSSNTYAIPTVSGATSYTWTLPGGWTGTSTITSITTTANSTGGNILVTADNACGQSSAQTLAVTVNAIPSKPTITASGLNTETITLTSSAAAGNQWFKDGAAITEATSASLIVTTLGVYKVQVTIASCISEFSTDFPIIVTGDLPTTQSGITVSPNPVEEVLEIRGIVGEVKSYALFDMAGRAANFVLEKRTDTYAAPVRHLSQGMYVLRLHVGDQIQQVKFVKK